MPWPASAGTAHEVAMLGRCHTSMLYPLHERFEIAQMFLMTRRTAPGRRVDKIERKFAANKVECAGP
jgi:hypothetical protein